MSMLSNEQFKEIVEKTKDAPAGAFLKEVIKVTGVDPRVFNDNENEITKSYRVELSCAMEATIYLTINHAKDASDSEIEEILLEASNEKDIDWESKWGEHEIDRWELGKE